jgi:hypothetical protein
MVGVSGKGGEGIGKYAGPMLSQCLDFGSRYRSCAPRIHLSSFMHSATAGYQCLEGDCPTQPNPRFYQNQQSLRQHQYKKHTNTKEEDTSLGRALTLKRAHDADVEAAQKRQLLEAEMACRTPEPEPPRPV